MSRCCLNSRGSCYWKFQSGYSNHEDGFLEKYQRSLSKSLLTRGGYKGVEVSKLRTHASNQANQGGKTGFQSILSKFIVAKGDFAFLLES